MGLDMFFTLVSLKSLKMTSDDSLKTIGIVGNAYKIQAKKDLEKISTSSNIKKACEKFFDKKLTVFENIYIETIQQVRIEFGYFRKFNALHGYIVEHYADGVDKCQPIKLSKQNCEEILADLKTIKDDHKQASVLMPYTPGFLFGSEEYDEYYFKDVEYACTMFETAISAIGATEDYIEYRASW